MVDRLEATEATVLAAESFVNNLGEFSGGHKFRALSIIALDYTARKNGILFDKNGHDITLTLLDLGVKINDHYDTSVFDSSEYKHLRKFIKADKEKEATFQIYYRVLRKLERERPSPGQKEDCVKYREKTNLISLATNCSFAFGIPLSDFVEINDSFDMMQNKPDAPKWFAPLYYSVMALQVVDDMVGREGDFINKRPSFFTAFNESDGEDLSDRGSVALRFRKMGELFNNYIRLAEQSNPEFVYPIALMSRAIYHSLPPLVEYLKRPMVNNVARLIVSKRDLNNK